MKRIFSKFSLMIALTAFSAALFASPASAHWMGKESSDKKAAHMKKELLLTDDQTSQVKDIYEDVKNKMKSLYQEKEDRINAVLTTEQRAKYAEDMKEWKEKRHEEKEEKEDKD